MNFISEKTVDGEFKKNANSFIRSFLLAFSILLFLIEAINYFLPVNEERSLSPSTIIFRKQATLLNLYSEDIWRNGRRTIETPFDISICHVEYKRRLTFTWSEYQCRALDEKGRIWTYTNRYSDNKSKVFAIPFLLNRKSPTNLKINNASEEATS